MDSADQAGLDGASTPPDTGDGPEAGSDERSSIRLSGDGPDRRQNRLRLGDLEIDTLSHQVSRDGETIPLPHLSWLLLLALVDRWPGIGRQDDLLAEVWPDVIVGEETLTQRVKLLRQSLGDDSRKPRYVTTIRGVGYRLAVGVESPGPEATAPETAALEAGWQDGGEEGDRRRREGGPHERGRMVIERREEENGERRGGLTGRRAGDQGGRSTRGRIRWGWITAGAVVVALLVASSLVMRGLRTHSGQAAPGTIADDVLPFVDSTRSLEAYNNYLLGRYHTFRQTPEDLDRAVGFLRRAVEIDPEFAEAWATLAWAHSFIGTVYGEEPPATAFVAAREAALRALALDGSLADARSVYADILTWYDWDWPAAEREYQETLRLDRDNVLGYAIFLSAQLREEEAIEMVEGVLERRPDDPYVHINAAWRFYGIRDYERALAEVELAGDHNDAGQVRGWSLFSLGATDEAVAVFEGNVRHSDRQPIDLSNLATAFAETGRREEARDLLGEMLALGETRYVSPNLVAVVYFALDELDEGFDWLDRGLEVRSREMVFLQSITAMTESETIRGT